MLNRSTIPISVNSPLSALRYFRKSVGAAEPHSRTEVVFRRRSNCGEPMRHTSHAAPRRFQMVTSRRCHKSASGRCHRNPALLPAHTAARY
ncbi:hypothetical protein BST25_12425 [Mycobacterium heidelbergense]|uniref:Uncharacterized protein n=1 Tax=Mycobacterium heidelbergense TaxID=53376 RepID=A0A1X0DMB4_MYCHE|nr:hypothetical protein BST25_12425 [Mycobacterium heidelbergense]